MLCAKKHRLSYTDKAKEIIEQLSLEEKVSLMGGNITRQEMLDSYKNGGHYNYAPYEAGGISEKEISSLRFCDGPRGVVCGRGKSTCFPVSMLRGASFDIELEEKIGNAIGKEVRAFGGNLFAGVCINLPYHPGWGRSQETYGEESFHLGQMGAALVRGVQEENVIACVKHYAFNQMEIARFKVSVECDKRTEREVFLPHFKECVDAGAASVMSSYNLYQSTHCGQHEYLLNKVLKKEWGFDGFVMSDFIWGITDTVAAANGGQDMEMCNTSFFGDKLVKAVEAGFVPEAKIDEAATRIIRTLLAFEEAYVGAGTYPESVIGCKEHIALALQSAREGMTLLQNKKDILPFFRKKVRKVVVLGKLAEKEVIGDHGSSQVYPKYVVTPLQGIANAAPEAEVIYYNGEILEHAKSLAEEADAVVFVVGYDHNDEGEYVAANQKDAYTTGVGGDRKSSLGLHEDEIELIKAAGPVNDNSCAILIGGNTILLEEWKDCVSSILMAYYPGMEGGTAIGEILFGDVNPSGKLPYVLPYKELDLPQVDWDAESQYYQYYHGYAKLEKEGVAPMLPYGFGLSYTTFQVTDPEFKVDGDYIEASCTIENTGDRAGTEVMQLYIGFQHSSVDRPVKLLRGFQRVNLKAGEKQEVHITCLIEKLCWYNPLSKKMELEHMEYEVYLGTSSDERDLLQGKIIL